MRSSFRKIKYGHTSMLTIIHFFLKIFTLGGEDLDIQVLIKIVVAS